MANDNLLEFQCGLNYSNILMFMFWFNVFYLATMYWFCRFFFQTYGCRNHITYIFEVPDGIEICGTGSYEPRTILLNVSMQVVSCWVSRGRTLLLIY